MRLLETGLAHGLQLSSRLMMSFKACRLTCPTTIHVHVNAVSWRAAGKRKCASGYSALRAIRANVRNCAQLRPAVGRNVCNCEHLCAIAPFRFARRFECEGRTLCSHTWKLTTRTQPVGHFLVFGFQAGTSNWDFVTSSTCTGSTRSQAALISMLGRRRH